jgi:chaperonin cofactor prefoldin
MSHPTSSRATAALESEFLTSLSAWRLAGQELDSLMSQKSRLQSESEERALLSDEFSLLDSTSVCYRMIGPLMSEITLQQAKESTEKRTKMAAEEQSRLEKRIRVLADMQRGRIEKLRQMQRQLPNIPDAIYSV